MGFTTPCFIRKNTPELLDKMKELGYVRMYSYKIQGIEIFTSVIGDYGVFFIPVSEDIPEIPTNMIKDFDSLIDCETNEELFLAITSLRDDSDDNQWFVMDVEVYTDIPAGTWFKSCRENNTQVGIQIDPMYCHKATVEELIEHFKK